MASRLQDVLMRGVAASRPLATSVAPGTLYFSTDTATTDQSDGAVWATYADVSSVVGKPGPMGPPGIDPEEPEIPYHSIPSPSASSSLKIRQITIIVDGAGSVLTTGVKGYKSFPVAGIITGVRLLADQSGSIVMDIWKDTYANYPPTVADTITAAAKPTIVTALKSEDTTLTGWTKTIAAGDVFGFNIDSVTTIQRIVLELSIMIFG